MGMEKFFGALAQRLSQEDLIQFLDIGILVALADGLVHVFLVDGPRTRLQDLD